MLCYQTFPKIISDTLEQIYFQDPRMQNNTSTVAQEDAHVASQTLQSFCASSPPALVVGWKVEQPQPKHLRKVNNSVPHLLSLIMPLLKITQYL